MVTQVDLCNMALDEVGTRSTITALNDGSPEARACSRHYDSILDQLLRSAQWSFARRFVSLTLLKSAPGTPTNPSGTWPNPWTNTVPPPPWLYQYAMPGDGTLIWYLIGQPTPQGGVPIFSGQNLVIDNGYGKPVRWTKANDAGADVILTNCVSAIACYTLTSPDFALWPGDFQRAFILALAGALAQPLSGDKELRKLLWAEANEIIRGARVNDANQGTTVYNHLPDWLLIRGAGEVGQDFFEYITPYGPLFGSY